MGLTRPTVAQLNTVVTEINDPVSVLNKGSTQANVDVGFVFNRDGGVSPNVAFYWNETTDSLVTAYTTSTGGVNSNIAVTSYANLTVGNITALNFIGSGAYLSSLPGYAYSNVNVKAYTESMGFQNYGNVNVAALITTNGLTNYSNVNLIAYLAGNITSTGFINTSGNVSAAQINSGTAVVTGSAFVGELFATGRSGDEGGQLNLALAVTNNSLSGNVTIDVFQNRLRIFESSGTNRGGYFDISTLSAGVGTNLAAGGGGTPGGGNGQIQFNQNSTFAGAASLYYFGANGAIVANAGIASTSTSTGTMQITGGIGVTGNVYADQIYAVNNGNGTNFRVGDDLWLGDVNIANTMRLMGAQDNTQAYIRFGNTQTNTLGVNGAGPLTWTGDLSVTGNMAVGNITTSSNSVANIGSVTNRFNTVHARATQAQYADLAEIYTSDQQYPGGTVVVFGGSSEVMQSHSSHDPRIAGVVSTDPAYLMNSTVTGIPVALQGRVPCRVLGPIEQGDRVVSSHIPGVAQRLDPQQYEPGCIIGKALQAIDSTDISVIEVVVGRV